MASSYRSPTPRGSTAGRDGPRRQGRDPSLSDTPNTDGP